jgi:hypothetical protein
MPVFEAGTKESDPNVVFVVANPYLVTLRRHS